MNTTTSALAAAHTAAATWITAHPDLPAPEVFGANLSWDLEGDPDPVNTANVLVSTIGGEWVRYEGPSRVWLDGTLDGVPASLWVARFGAAVERDLGGLVTP